MFSQEINRVNKEADTAVLFIHGIIECSDFFTEYIPLVPLNCSVCSILLDGHGRTVEEFCASSMEKWKQQVEDKIAELSATHKNILIVGHSMGSLFAIEQAVAHAECVRAIFIMGTPLRLFITPLMPWTMLKIYFNHFDTNDERIMTYYRAYGLKSSMPLWKYVGWIPRYVEMFRDIKVAREALTQLRVPCWAVHFYKDEVVSRTVIPILSAHPCVKLTVLKHSQHIYYPKEDYKILMDAFSAFVREFSQQ